MNSSKIALALALTTSGFVIAEVAGFDVRLSVLVCIFYLIYEASRGTLYFNKHILCGTSIVFAIIFICGALFGLYSNPIKPLSQGLLIIIILSSISQMMRKVGIFESCKLYFKIVYIAAIIGIIQFIIYLAFQLNINPLGPFPGYLFNDKTIRVSSIFSEPSSFGFFCYFAIAYFVLTKNKENICTAHQKIVISIAFLLTGSSVALIFVALLFTYKILVNSKFIDIVYIAPILLVLLLLITSSNEINSRLTEVYFIFVRPELLDESVFLGTSSLSLYNNFIVAINSFMNNPFLGSGIGNHSIAYDAYIVHSELPDVGLNKGDANSMYLRVVSEIGLTGIFVFFAFIVMNLVRGQPLHAGQKSLKVLNIVSLAAFLGYMIRFGVYYETVFIFYVLIFYLSASEYKKN